MFHAIANFFFGGESPAPTNEESVECCTKEAEDADWLLVDVSDPDETAENSSNKENELPKTISLSPPEQRILPLESSLDLSFVQPLEVMYCKDRLLLTPSSCLVSELIEQSSAEALPTERFVGRAPLGRVCRSSVLASILESFVNVELRLSSDSVVIKSIVPRTEKKLLPFGVKRGPRRRPTQANAGKSKPEKLDRHQSHPAEIGAFVNHQPSPVLVSKTEHLQQIKELKPSQQAKEYEIKKRQKRNQLNRQNKVYLYESSNKNQHRKDLWWRHSGVNNNRKCC